MQCWPPCGASSSTAEPHDPQSAPTETTPLQKGPDRTWCTPLAAYVSGLWEDAVDEWYLSHQLNIIVYDWLFSMCVYRPKITLQNTHDRAHLWYSRENRLYVLSPFYWVALVLALPFGVLGLFAFRTLSLNRFDTGPLEAKESAIVFVFRAIVLPQLGGVMATVVGLSIFLLAVPPSTTPHETIPSHHERTVAANVTRLLIALLYNYGLMILATAMRRLDQPLMHASLGGFVAMTLTLIALTIYVAGGATDAHVPASQYSTVVSCAITDVLLMGCTPLFAWPACRDMVRRHAGDLEEQRVRKDSAADMLCGCERGRVQAAAVVVVALLVAGATSGLIVWSFELDRAGFFEVFSGLLPGGSR